LNTLNGLNALNGLNDPERLNIEHSVQSVERSTICETTGRRCSPSGLEHGVDLRSGTR